MGAQTAPYLRIEDLEACGARALVTTRAAGSLALSGTDEVGATLDRWQALRVELGVAGPGSRFATSMQIHGASIIVHRPGWTGWLRVDGADGHVAPEPGTGLGVTVADCVPVFLAHPSGAVALVHAGWRGTAGGILTGAVHILRELGFPPADLHVHLGPAICGDCYEVGPDVYAQLTGDRPAGPRTVDLRGVLADQARSGGVGHIETSPWCTRCHNDLFFSHRAGDAGRQVAAITAAVGG
jgi:YfiH family protein